MISKLYMEIGVFVLPLSESLLNNCYEQPPVYLHVTHLYPYIITMGLIPKNFNYIAHTKNIYIHMIK